MSSSQNEGISNNLLAAVIGLAVLMILALWLLVRVVERPTPSTVVLNTPSAPTAHWREIARWEGTASRQTELFAISGRQWRVRWEVAPSRGDNLDMIGIVALRENGEGIGMALDMDKSETGETVFHESGNFYLSITSGRPYRVLVEDYTP
jgi:hypothetical protein